MPMLLAAAGPSQAANIVILVVGLIIGVPTSYLAIVNIKDRGAKHEERRINSLIARQLIGEHAVAHPVETSPDNPSIRDLLHDVLGESAASTAELAIIKEILRIHVSDRHGPAVPDYLMRQ